jgi:hypothetical protein
VNLSIRHLLLHSGKSDVGRVSGLFSETSRS